MKNSKNTAGKLLLAGAAAIGASAAAVSIRGKAGDRDREERAAMFRAADDEIATMKAKRTATVLYLVSVGFFLAAIVATGFDLWAAWSLTGFGTALMGAAWTHEDDFRARFAWIPLTLGTLLFICSFITFCVTRADSFLSFIQSFFT